MKFKHSEPLEVPPWKRSRRSGREAKKRERFVALMPGYHRGAWLAAAATAAAAWFCDPERFHHVCHAPHDAFSRDPSQQSGTNWEGGRGAGAKES